MAESEPKPRPMEAVPPGSGQGWKAVLKNGKQVVVHEIPVAPAAAQAAAPRLQRLADHPHPSLSPVLAWGTDANGVWVAVEPNEGTPLSAVLSRGRFTPHAAASLGTQLLSGLAALHEAGVAMGGFDATAVRLTGNGSVRIAGHPVAAVRGAPSQSDLRADVRSCGMAICAAFGVDPAGAPAPPDLNPGLVVAVRSMASGAMGPAVDRAQGALREMAGPLMAPDRQLAAQSEIALRAGGREMPAISVAEPARPMVEDTPAPRPASYEPPPRAVESYSSLPAMPQRPIETYSPGVPSAPPAPAATAPDAPAPAPVAPLPTPTPAPAPAASEPPAPVLTPPPAAPAPSPPAPASWETPAPAPAPAAPEPAAQPPAAAPEPAFASTPPAPAPAAEPAPLEWPAPGSPDTNPANATPGAPATPAAPAPAAPPSWETVAPAAAAAAASAAPAEPAAPKDPAKSTWTPLETGQWTPGPGPMAHVSSSDWTGEATPVPQPVPDEFKPRPAARETAPPEPAAPPSFLASTSTAAPATTTAPPIPRAAAPAPTRKPAQPARRESAMPSGRPAWLIPAAIGVVVLLVLGTIGFVLASRGGTSTSTHAQSSPHPTASAKASPSPTNLLKDVPVYAPAAAAPVTSVIIDPANSSCTITGPCKIEVDIKFSSVQRTNVSFIVKFFDRCSGQTTDLPGANFTPPGFNVVILDKSLALPQGAKSAAIVAVTQTPAAAASAPMLLGANSC